MVWSTRYILLITIALYLCHASLSPQNVNQLVTVVFARPIIETSKQQHRRIKPVNLFTTVKSLFLKDAGAEASPNVIVASATSRTTSNAIVLAKQRQKVLATPSRSTRDTDTLSSSLSSSRAALMNGMKSAIASACAAACCKAILQPIDAMKTVQQFYVGQHSLSLYEAAQHLLQKPGGFKNLYAGLGVTMIGSMPSVGLYFGVYSYCKQHFLATKRGRRYTTVSIALSAAIGNTIASVTRVPYEVMKQHLQTGLYDSTWSLVRDMIRHPSTATQLLFPKGGVWIQMIRDVPYAVVTLLLYESLQQHFGNKSQAIGNRSDSGQSTKSPFRDAMLGGFAGGVGSWVTNPMDVIKTRLQTDTNSNVYSGSIAKCFTSVWQEGGTAAFLRGSIPRLVHKVPANAFFFLFYEFFKRILHA